MHERPARDLYALLPEHLRNRDAEAGRPLAALMRLMAGELQRVEQDLDQLYDNWFIETCEPWVIPYIAALVGVRPLRDFGQGQGALRGYVANMLGYRQAKGTAAAIEQVARDATGWPVLAVEGFERLAMSQHLNHVRPQALAFASVRDAEGARRAHGPFDPHCHAGGVGPAGGYAGRHTISHVALEAWRVRALPLGFMLSDVAGYRGGPVPRVSALGAGLLHLDRLGRDIAMMNIPKADLTIAGRVGERMVPAALDRRRLHVDLNGLRGGAASVWFDDEPVLRVRLDGVDLPPDRLFACRLEPWDVAGQPVWHRPVMAGSVCFDPELGRIALHVDDEGKALEAAWAWGAAHDAGGGPQDRAVSVEGWASGFFVAGEAEPWCVGVSARARDAAASLPFNGPVFASLAAAVAAWNGRGGGRGIITMLDNATYDEDLMAAANRIRLAPGARLAIVAASDLVRSAGDAVLASGCQPHLRGGIAVLGEAGVVGDVPGVLILDGVLVEGEIKVRDGELGRLEVHHCTLGGSAAGLDGGVEVLAGNAGLSVVVRHSVVGALRLGPAAGGLVVTDSVVGQASDLSQAPAVMMIALNAPQADAEVARSTVLGRTEVRTIEAENCLFVGRARAAQRQAGCARYCYAPAGSRLPRRFRCQPEMAVAAGTAAMAGETERRLRPFFVSLRFGDAGFARLADAADVGLREGGEGGAEMGLGFSGGEPFRRRNLDDVLEDHLPFGLVAAPVFMS